MERPSRAPQGWPALLILGGASLLLLNHKDESWSAPQGKMGQQLFPNLAIADVAAVHIKAAGELHLELKGGTWSVRERGGYPANFSQLRETIIKLADLKIAHSDPIGPSQLAHMELEPPGKGAGSGTLTISGGTAPARRFALSSPPHHSG